MFFPRFFIKRKDGGNDSNVTGYWLIEWKSLFSIALLRFSKGSRENMHSHAFNAWSWILKGELRESLVVSKYAIYTYILKPSIKPIYTPRDCMHQVFGVSNNTWAITFRGPWKGEWYELTPDNELITLTHGRNRVT